LLTALALLFGAIGYTLILSFAAKSAPDHPEFIDNLPTRVDGWEVKDLKIAENESMQKAVDEQLNYDQAVFREYRQGTKAFQIYVARWSARKMHPRLISIHVPDRCWVVNGWKMSEPEYNYQLNLPGEKIHHGQYRYFSTEGGQGLHVLYWHLLGNELSGYAEGPNSLSGELFKSLLTGIHGNIGEQFFIRLSSPQPWDEWVNDKLFQQVLGCFAPILTGDFSDSSVENK
jgi:hypothetical protein